MKTQKTATLLILLLFSVCGYAQNTEITKVPENPTSENSIEFFGKIKSVTETSYATVEKFGEVSKGEKYETKVFKCDNKKNLIEYEHNYKSENEYKNEKTTIKYNENGNEIEKKTYTNEKLDFAITWKYNNKGYVTEQNSYGADGRLDSAIIRKYNDKGDLTEYNSYGVDGRLNSAITWKYNDKEYVTERYGADKVLFSKTKLKWDDKDRIIERGEYDSLGNIVSKETFEYDVRGDNTGHSEYDKNGKLAWKCTRQFDDKGNEINNVRITYDDSKIDTLWTKISKYDEFGNLIEYDEYPQMPFGVGACRDEACIILREKARKLSISHKCVVKYNKNKIKIESRNFYCRHYYDEVYNEYYGNTFYFYNSNGKPKLAYSSYVTHDDIVTMWCKKYDEEGNIVEDLKKELDEWRSPIIRDPKTFIYKYNEEEAKKIEKEIVNIIIKEFDTKTEYIYTFDKYGNWITKTTYTQKLNSMPTCTGIIEREIEYY